MKEFNLNEYLKDPSKKVITRDGRNVRIICTNMKSEYPLIALVSDKKDNTESPFVYTKNGRYFFEETNNDLFFAPDKKEGWVNIYKRMTKCSYVEESIYSSKEIAIKNKFGDSYVTTIKIEWEE